MFKASKWLYRVRLSTLRTDTLRCDVIGSGLSKGQDGDAEFDRLDGNWHSRSLAGLKTVICANKNQDYVIRISR